jgi:PEP-CTERM motif-containing protein
MLSFWLPKKMNRPKKFNIVTLIFLVLTLSTSWTGASVTLQFNNNPNDIVGGSPETIQTAPGASIVVSLQLVSTAETTTALTYWLAQFSGPGSGVFSITGRDRSGGDFNRGGWGDTVVTSAGDSFSNSQSLGLGQPDGVPDNLLSPRNGPSFGSIASGTSNPPGGHQVATFTLTISLGALPGLYEIRTFDYPGNGYGDENFQDHDFDAHAAIRVEVVPEPATWLLVGLGLLVLFGLNRLRLAIAPRVVSEEFSIRH